MDSHEAQAHIAENQQSSRRTLWKWAGGSVLGVVVLLWLLENGLLDAWSPIAARVTTSDDQLAEEYFLIDAERFSHVRNIAVIEGTFTMNTGLGAALYLVRSGTIDKQNTLSGSLSPNQIPHPLWRSLRIRLALAETALSGQRTTILGSRGFPRGGGVGPGPSHSIDVKSAWLMPGRISHDIDCVLYVEGDREPELTPGMTIEDFARSNRDGEFLVVTAGVR